MGQFSFNIQSLGERLFKRFPEHAEMSHFTPRTAFHFPVQVEFGTGVVQNGSQIGLPAAFPQVAEQIYHDSRPQERRRPKRQAADRTQLLFKLAGQTGVKRIMPRVVRPRSEFVYEQLIIARQKELHRDEANDIKIIRDIFRNRHGAPLDFGLNSRRDNGIVQNVPSMHILCGWERAHGTVAVPCTDDRNFAVEWNPLFENSPGRAEPRKIESVTAIDFSLSFPVVAEVGSFQNRGRTDSFERNVQFRLV